MDTDTRQKQHFKIEEFVFGLFEDGAYPAEVVAINDNNINTVSNLLSSKGKKTSDIGNGHLQ